jgi:hypothetical protein
MYIVQYRRTHLCEENAGAIGGNVPKLSVQMSCYTARHKNLGNERWFPTVLATECSLLSLRGAYLHLEPVNMIFSSSPIFTYNQCFGSGLIESGSSILAKFQSGCGSMVLTTKIYNWKINSIYIYQKFQFTYL